MSAKTVTKQPPKKGEPRQPEAKIEMIELCRREDTVYRTGGVRGRTGI